MGKLVVVGSINTDLTIFADQFPLPSENIIANDYMICMGGKGANQAVAAARFGSQVWMIGCVGDDAHGTLALERFQDNNINTDGIVKIKGASTGTAFIHVAGGENTITIVKGANEMLTPELVMQHSHLIDDADMVLIQYEIPTETIDFTLNYCKERKIKTLINPAPDATMTRMEWIEAASFFIPNANEVKMLFKDRELDEVLCRYPNKLVVTRGGEGSVFFDGTKVVVVPPIKIIPVDPTGAGDTFCGVLASAFCDGKGLAESIGYANTAAGISTTHKGCQSSMPDRAEVLKFFEKQ